MADRLRVFGRRLADLGSTLVDALVRDNRVLPPVLAVLALFIIAWILAGAFMGEPDQETVAHRADLAQSDGGRSGSDPAPGVENRDVNSYAAYRSKDPFRELIAPEETAPEQPATTTPEQTTPETTTGRPGGGPGAGGAARDKDADGVPDRRERRVGTDPNTPDTDDANGRPDTSGNGAGSGAGSGTATTPGAGQPGRGGNRATGGKGGGLLNSGGTLPLP